MDSIGVVRSPYREKFGIPRQPGLTPSIRAEVRLRNDADLARALRGLELFTHVWLITWLHAHGAKRWKPSVRPPRLGGARKIGVLASRSPHRPNPIGISAVRLLRVDASAKGGPVLEVAGADLLDGTPVLDVKPYIPYCDSIRGAGAGWAAGRITQRAVRFTREAGKQLRELARERAGEARRWIRETLAIDPRPAFQQRKLSGMGTRFGMRFLDWDVKWRVADHAFEVFEIAQGAALDKRRTRQLP